MKRNKGVFFSTLIEIFPKHLQSIQSMSKLQEATQAEAMALCMSNYVDMDAREILELVSNAANLSKLINDLLIDLKSAKQAKEAKEAKCQICHVVHKEKFEHFRCSHCRVKNICSHGDCTYDCTHCSEIFCRECFSKTVRSCCSHYLCNTCQTFCSDCSTIICDDCVEKCSKCDDLYCSHCITTDGRFCKQCVMQSIADFQTMMANFEKLKQL